MIAMITRALEYIDSHPRLILMLAWPVLSLFVAALILIVWKGPWHADAEHQQLNILGNIAFGLLGVFAISYLAQSMALFGKVSFRLGGFINVDADINKPSEHPDLRTAPPAQEHKDDRPH